MCILTGQEDCVSQMPYRQKFVDLPRQSTSTTITGEEMHCVTNHIKTAEFSFVTLTAHLQASLTAGTQLNSTGSL